MTTDCKEMEIRETYLINLRYFLNQSKNIPVAIILDPLVNAFGNPNMLQNGLETFDFDFLNYIAAHPKTNEKSGLLLIEMLSKVYVNKIPTGMAAKGPLISVIERFVASSPKIQEWIKTYFIECLQSYMQLLGINYIANITEK